MIALLQRVTRASVTVETNCIAEINQGLLVFIGVEREDTLDKVNKLVYKLLNYRVFSDDDGKMNLSVQDICGQVLLVPQFTLAADTQKGLRPGFSSAASPAQGLELFTQVVDIMAQQLERSEAELSAERLEMQLPEASLSQSCKQKNRLQTGQFGADMAVELVNDGPVTFYLQV